MAKQNSKPTPNDEQEYYVYPVMEGTNYTEHDANHPFCDDLTCPCHEDGENLQTLQGWYNDGLIGSVDGDTIYRGRTI